MPTVIKRILQALLVILLITVGLLGSIVLVAYLTQYRPREAMPLQILEASKEQHLKAGEEYSFITWNIGYGALGEHQTFFMDGGTGSGAEHIDEVNENISFMTDYIHSQNVDFILLQEVDSKGKRSYNVNQFEAFQGPNHYSTYAINYQVFFVPVPFLSPMGNVESGIVTLSKAKPSSAFRYSFDGKEMALQQLFDLNRCFTILRYPTDSDKELVLINAHFSAFDKGGVIREQQLAQMEKVLAKEYRKGNYVILGGDFNHELPGTDAYQHTWVGEYPDWAMRLPSSFDPLGYLWAVDTEHPTCRGVDKPYVPNKNFVCTLDGFLVSDTVEIVSVNTREDFAFKHSDHNPVELIVRLKDIDSTED